MNCIIFMSFTMLLGEFYIYGFQYTYANIFDWPRSICSWMNIMILMSFCMLLDEIYIYVFQCAPGWNLYLCLSVCSWMKCMIFMSFSMLLAWNLWYLCFSFCSWMNCMIFMSVNMLLNEFYDIYVCVFLVCSWMKFISVFQYAPGWNVWYLCLSVYTCSFDEWLRSRFRVTV